MSDSQLHNPNRAIRCQKTKGVAHPCLVAVSISERKRPSTEEFVEKCCGEKSTDHQIKHLLGSDMRLTGETFERVKRKILALMKTKQKQMKKDSASLPTVPVPTCGGKFSYQGYNIEILNSCPIENLLTAFHLLCSSNSDFLKAFTNLLYQGMNVLRSV